MNDGPEYTLLEQAPTIIGVPGIDGTSPLVEQGYDDTCAIRSQELILRNFGVNISEDSLCQKAIENGWYVPGQGTDQSDVGNLLELHGVEVNRYENANIFNLTSELAKGHKVIIAVDSGELWTQGSLEEQEDQSGRQIADHALIVSGIDTTDPNDVKVILTDPGSGDIAKEYPMSQFIDAWQDSNFYMVATTEPAPLAFNPGMTNFDYSLGHIENIGHLPYEDFQERFAPCLELDISESVLNDQAELLAKFVAEEDFVIEESIPIDLVEDTEDVSAISLNSATEDFAGLYSSLSLSPDEQEISEEEIDEGELDDHMES